MALLKTKPTSPGRRGMLKVVTPNSAQRRASCVVARKENPWFWP